MRAAPSSFGWVGAGAVIFGGGCGAGAGMGELIRGAAGGTTAGWVASACLGGRLPDFSPRDSGMTAGVLAAIGGGGGGVLGVAGGAGAAFGAAGGDIAEGGGVSPSLNGFLLNLSLRGPAMLAGGAGAFAGAAGCAMMAGCAGCGVPPMLDGFFPRRSVRGSSAIAGGTDVSGGSPAFVTPGRRSPPAVGIAAFGPAPGTAPGTPIVGCVPRSAAAGKPETTRAFGSAFFGTAATSPG